MTIVLSKQDFASSGDLQIRLGTVSLAGLLNDCRLGLRVGVPTGATTLAEVGIYLGATVSIASLSVGAVAAHTLVMRLAGVAYALPLALSQVTAMRMAHVSGWNTQCVVIRTQFQFALCSALFVCKPRTTGDVRSKSAD